MPARTGADYIAALKRMKPCIYYDGRLVEDVTEEPVFKGPIESIAQMYDLQHDPRYMDFMLYESPTTGDPVGRSFQVPYSKEDLVKKRQAFKLRTDHNFGTMGRSMDFMNGLVTGWYLGRERFAQRGQQFGENAANYYEYVRENDLFLTHVLITPQTDRSKTSAEQEDPLLHLGRVRETKDGVIVSGAKMLGTMAPITEEILCVPFGGIAPGDDAYAISFAIPNDAPGLKYICRESVAKPPLNRFDHPLSSRFEEMDCVAIFDDVLIPWDRIIVDGGPGSADLINSAGGAMAAMTNAQTSSRMLSQLELLCGVAMRVADNINITGFLHVQEKLGEMVTDLEIARGVYYGAEAMAHPTPEGMWTYTSLAPRAFHMKTMRIYRRFVEIIQVLAAGGFFQAPTEADMANPEERPLIDKYLRGREGVTADERVRLFKLAWDLTGSSFAQRLLQYVSYYSGDPLRLTAGYYLAYNKQPLFDLVARALGERDDLDIEPSAEDPGALPATRPAIPQGALAAQYPAGSLPKPSETKS